MARPNILLITAHDIGRYLGCYGVATAPTPGLDRLAAEGVCLERCFAAAPTCSPSRAALFTGRHPQRNGVLGLTHGNFGWQMKDGEQHLAGLLREGGYDTAVFGVMHEGIEPERAGVGSHRLFTGEDRPDCDALVAETRAWIDRERPDDQPWFVHLGTFEPHRPFAFGGVEREPERGAALAVPDALVDTAELRADLAHFEAAIGKLDRALGRLFDHLDAQGLADNTLVLFQADHGTPYPRAKASLYDAGLGIAALARWPAGGWSGGRRSRALASNIDVLPTLLEAAGIEIPDTVQGCSLAGVLSGSDTEGPNEAVFGGQTYHGGSVWFDPRRCIRTATHKLIANFTHAAPWPADSEAWVADDLRAALAFQTAHGATPCLECYDLEADPGERENLAARDEPPDVVRDLADRLQAWMRATEDPLLAGYPVPPVWHDAMGQLRGG